MGNYISTIDLTHEEWLRQRQNFITASGYASIIGANPYQTPYEYWEEKKAAIPRISEDTERMEIGRIIEGFIAEYWSSKFNRKVQKDNKIRISKDYPMAVNMDRVILKENERTPGYLECKNVDLWVYNGWDTGPDGEKLAPVYYYTQVMFGLAVTGYEFGYHAILVGGNHLVSIRYERDEKLIQEIKNFSKEWWERYILGDEVPDKMVTDFRNTPIEDIKGTIEASQEFILKHKLLLEAKSELAKWNDRKKDLESQVQELIGDNETVTYLGQEIATWKGQSRINVDQKRLKEEKPEIFNEYSAVSQFRVLRQKNIKEQTKEQAA